MSLRKIMNPKPQKKEPKTLEPETILGMPNGEASLPEELATTVGSPATISADRKEGLKKVLDILPGSGQQGAFSLTDLLSMDSESIGLPGVLGYPIGVQEKDMYRMLERTSFDQYTKDLYTDGIHLASHGIGWGKPGDPNGLDFTLPQLGEWIVSKMRGAVSVNGHSLEVFERTTSPWVQALYKHDEELKKREGRGVQQ